MPTDLQPFDGPVAAKENGSLSPTPNPSLFEQATNIDYRNWNKAFPYQLLLYKRTPQGKWTAQDNTCNRFKFTLPFTPESLSLSMPFAINTYATQGGVVEEHNGAPFRQISFSGTTGVMPLKGHAPIRDRATLPQAIFAGTLNQASRVAQAGGRRPDPNVMTDLDVVEQYKSSGYYQIRLLQKFFEDYAAFKKTRAGRNYQLAFAMWKDEAVYLVTPQSFAIQRSASSPFEYTYGVSLKAWARIIPDIQGQPFASYRPQVREPSALAALLNAISDAREVLADIKDTIAAVAGDIDHALFEPIREVGLFAKELLGVPLALTDVPTQILQNCQKAVIAYVSTAEAFDAAGESFSEKDQQTVDAWTQLAALGGQLGAPETGGSDINVNSSAVTSSSANDPFQNPSDYISLFNKIPLSRLKLPAPVIGQLAAERDRVSQLTRYDFEQKRDAVKAVVADFADGVGAGSARFNSTFGRPGPKSTKTPTAEDYRAMYALNRVVMEMNRLAVSQKTNQFQLSAEQFVAGLANASGITFNVPASKFAVPFPYASTLEELSETYLGTRDRWLEIATLNELRAPYVDEIGFDLPLLTPGSGDEVMVADASNLYVGQMVWLSSTSSTRSMRHIEGIRQLSDTQYVLTLDGEPDLDRYSPPAQAVVHAFLPNTVNSMMTVYIPSDKPSQVPDYETKSIPGVNEHDRLFAVGGVDLLLTPDNDLVVTPDGDGRVAVGLTAIVQDARLKLSVVRGSLPRHPQFGLGVKIGSSTADVDANDLLKAAQETFGDDPTYTGISSAFIQKTGPSIQIALQLGVAGVAQEIPLAFKISP